RGETVQFLVRQNEPGLRMYHCHILEHEDQGMMGVVAVV
ncbi:MAG: multicopper oxidase domain-containing protein, partial [Candidatus Nanopelagicales bacterium]|nr:multicopper oxidase domain-containing protein [Candidatus Nanopelagicales bacterium]